MKRIILAALALTVAGCSATPNITAAYNQRGLAAAFDEALTQTYKRVVMTCTLLDDARVSLIVDATAGVAGQTAVVERLRAERQDECDKANGVLTVDVQ